MNVCWVQFVFQEPALHDVRLPEVSWKTPSKVGQVVCHMLGRLDHGQLGSLSANLFAEVTTLLRSDMT